MRTMLRAVALATVLLLTGCSMGASDVSGEPAVSDGGAVDAPAPGEAPAEEGGEVDLDGDGEARQMIITVDVRMTVEDPAARSRDLATLTTRAGGWVAERSVTAGDEDEPGFALMTVRVPSEEVENLLDQLDELGTVDHTDQQGTDVTDTVKDLDARIRALEISVTRLEDLLARAETTAAIIEAEQVLTDRQAQLEALLTQRESLAGRVAMATLTVEMYTEDSVPPEPPTGFFAGLSTGWSSLVAGITSFLTALGVALPWLVFLGLLGLLVAFAVRRWLRSRPPRTPRAASGPTMSLAPEPRPDARQAPVAPTE